MEIQNVGKNKKQDNQRDQARILANIEKNLVLQKIKQKELSPKSQKNQDEENVLMENDLNLNSFEQLSLINSIELKPEIRFQNQNMLNVSPSRNYLRNLENIENERFACYQQSPNTNKR